METKRYRNIGVVGHVDSGTNELFDAILRNAITPKEDYGAAIVDPIDTTEFETKPYNAKNRDKLNWKKE